MRKKKWMRRALAAEAALLELRIPERTYETLTVDFVGRSVTWQDRTIHTEAQGLSVYILSSRSNPSPSSRPNMAT